jgi:ectoine hydroxylase-related dioxygenase (phytanoyl-CoA dioxygenase family)
MVILLFQVALDDSTLENGCLWFVPGSHKLPLREHHPAGSGSHVLECVCSEVSAY